MDESCANNEGTQGVEPAHLEELPLLWYGMYLIVAAVVAVATVVCGCWFREENIAAPDHPGVMSALAGMLWPVLLVGMSEMALLCWALRIARYAPLDTLPFV